MPILSITQNLSWYQSMPEIGRIYKGEEKPEKGNKPGADLDNYFRVEMSDGFEHLAGSFEAMYGPRPGHPDAAQQGHLPLNCWLMAPAVEDSIDSWMETWNGAHHLNVRCNGEQIQKRWLPVKEGSHDGMYVTSKTECERVKTERETEAHCAACPLGCKQTARMNIMLPDFMFKHGTWGYFLVVTHSKWDIEHLYSMLITMYWRRKDLSDCTFRLTRRKQQRNIIIPNGNGTDKRMSREFSLISFELEEETTRKLLSGEQNQLSLPSPGPDDGLLLLNHKSDNSLGMTALKNGTLKMRLGAGDKPRRMGVDAKDDGQPETIIEPEDIKPVEESEIEFPQPPQSGTITVSSMKKAKNAKGSYFTVTEGNHEYVCRDFEMLATVTETSQGAMEKSRTGAVFSFPVPIEARWEQRERWRIITSATLIEKEAEPA